MLLVGCSKRRAQRLPLDISPRVDTAMYKLHQRNHTLPEFEKGAGAFSATSDKQKMKSGTRLYSCL